MISSFLDDSGSYRLWGAFIMNINGSVLLRCRSFIGKRFLVGGLPGAWASTVERTLAIIWKWFLNILGITNL